MIDTATYKVKKYLLVGQRVWQMAFTPDDKYLLTTNGLSNDVSVVDVASLNGDQVDPGRAAALGRSGVAEMNHLAAAAKVPAEGLDVTLVPALAVAGVSHCLRSAQGA